ncbi:DEAD/DEAH box helicase [Mycolicibacterium llatzerense]|uniref:RNA helicase n=1 Tax=Mycolicibacterium llatzerense TaxID=280871 RepID=A0A0D1LNX4_9MYCO|nr:ATP-binding domain-containing protein [Mycolicibacterium llatzerense]KIU17726.1 RNA helicase [Mycolicibacterium llatzerense]
MALEVVYGESRDRVAANRLAALLRPVVSDGTIYLAYPVLTTADERVEVDGLLVSESHGLVAFLVADAMPSDSSDWSSLIEKQDRLYSALTGNLRRYDNLRSGRNLAVDPVTVTIFPTSVDPPPEADAGIYTDFARVGGIVHSLNGVSEDIKRNLDAALQRVSTIKPAKKRANVVNPGSRGAKLKEIEKGIANLDQWQKSAAIESPDCPQRIRGLAGSGKTVVLSLKAAYWHTQHPEWNIALTFASRALYQQIEDLVTRFTFEHSNDQPDRTKLQILHSWGSRWHAGLYSTIAAALGQPARDFAFARGQYGMDDAFTGICRELLDIAQAQPSITPIFDAVLIDEAQDLPPEFFQLVYLFTKAPKRIVWGFDELQKLSESAMPTTDELFGVDTDGQSRVSLENPADGPRRDIVLPVCYRNTPWALVTAHALGMGIYRDPDGLIQHPDDPKLWGDIGYQPTRGRLEFGDLVTLERRPDASPRYFSELLTPDDAVVIRTFDSQSQQDRWVAEQIRINLTDDELEPDDILIVLPDTYRARSRGARIMAELQRLNIASHLVGVTTSQDAVFSPESVAIAHIYRAKGNEAPMVYVLDAQYANSQWNLVSRRNTLFTAITRSRAWVRIVGSGVDARPVIEEALKVQKNDYQLKFDIPTVAQLAELRHIHRERPEENEEAARKATEGLGVFLEAFGKGVLDYRDLPPAMRTQLAQSLTRQQEVEEEAFGDD